MKVRFICDGEKGDIVNQYVTFTQVYNEQFKKHGRTPRAICEVMKICKEKNLDVKVNSV